MISKIRNLFPLPLRRAIGPYVAYIFYKFNLLFRPNRQRPGVLSIERTINEIIGKNLSVIRFGDGELSLIDNQDLGFQTRNPVLAKRLLEIIQSNDPGLMLCIPGMWENIDGFNKREFWFALHHTFRYTSTWLKILDPNRVYGDTFITRLYLTFKDKARSGDLFKKIFSLWQNRDTILIEGEKSRLGVGNNMFRNTKSLRRILAPAENAFSRYEEIKAEALKIDKNCVILLSLGPTAKVLAYDLYKLGYRVIDIGHIAMEYEMFLRGETKIIKVPGKYFNEINERNPGECNDKDYQSEIIARIY